jgi:hypothetical protein
LKDPKPDPDPYFGRLRIYPGLTIVFSPSCLLQNGAVTPGPQDSLSSPATPYQMIPAFYDTNGALRIGSSARLVPPLIINPGGGQQAGGQGGFPNLNSSLNLGSPLSSAMRHARDPFTRKSK